MSGAVTRKIAIAQQLEEQRLTMSEAPPMAASASLQEERVRRRQAILQTLQFNMDHEHLFRAWLAERKGGGPSFRIRAGRLVVFTSHAEIPLSDFEANAALERFDHPLGTSAS